MYTVHLSLYITSICSDYAEQKCEPVNLQSIYSVAASCCLSAPEEWQQKVSDLAMRRVTVGVLLNFYRQLGQEDLQSCIWLLVWMRSWISANASSWATRIEHVYTIWTWCSKFSRLQRQTSWNPQAFAWFEFVIVWYSFLTVQQVECWRIDRGSNLISLCSLQKYSIYFQTYKSMTFQDF